MRTCEPWKVGSDRGPGLPAGHDMAGSGKHAGNAGANLARPNQSKLQARLTNAASIKLCQVGGARCSKQGACAINGGGPTQPVWQPPPSAAQNAPKEGMRQRAGGGRNAPIPPM